MSTLKNKSEKIKQSKTTVKKPKETSKATKKISDSSKKHIAEVLDSIKEKLNQQEIEDTFAEDITNFVEESAEEVMEVAEKGVNIVTNSYSQAEMNHDFNPKIITTVEKPSKIKLQKTDATVEKNIEASQQLALKNVTAIMSAADKNANLAMNINKKWFQGINNQMESLLNLQTESVNKFTNWTLSLLENQ